ncbi:HAMP domain-containing sensor histidine kinase [Fictibacillus nanhaiensis]|uniref:sensor histidine kinase n=1 Tax=Fictibacillus nanhaiensis TaxID=742169 RepID=UPI002E1AF64F|nr:HAMP domain-containing sensor histidine kinase [Fictibacillus nanhaiensis]
MYIHKKSRTTLLKYWTTRYVLTLFVGLLILGLCSLWWIRHTALENRLTLMEYMAADTADRIEFGDKKNDLGRFNRKLYDRSEILQMEKPPELYITDLDGTILNLKSLKKGPDAINPSLHLNSIPVEIVDSKKTTNKFKMNGSSAYAVKKPLMYAGVQAGWVIIIQTASNLTDVNQGYRLPIFLLISLGLLGWLIIYILLKRILKPIQDVAHAAAQIKDGNYDIQLATDAKEQEMYDLLTSFEQMSTKLRHLEKLRAELLAGVTHDLKTPVTSISGLVQAVKDGIVSGDEKEEFLQITMNEIYRLQRMIEDLLDYNSLSAGAFTMRNETCNMNELVQDIVHQWRMTKKKEVMCNAIVPESLIYREVDPLRLQQIIINLLNNAYQALGDEKVISVVLYENRIEVSDTGSGIPENEQPYIFERFFRGEKKKLKVRGLGLGLPFSKMLAKAVGADLVLKKSSTAGSTFLIEWKK